MSTLSVATSISTFHHTSITTSYIRGAIFNYNYLAILGIAIFTVSRIQTGSYLRPFENRRRCLQVAKSGVRLSAQILPTDRRRPIVHSTRMQSASAICAAAAALTAVEERTQTIKHKARTTTRIPVEKNLPKRYDGGSGFPAGGFHRASGGDGGGGNNKPSSDEMGGLRLLGILGVLDYLKDLETREIKKKKREELDRDDGGRCGGIFDQYK